MCSRREMVGSREGRAGQESFVGKACLGGDSQEVKTLVR